MSSPSVWVQEVLAPQSGDSTDVRWAVETASAMWTRGDRDLCLRWVHHAVQAATADGRHQRADDLDRAAQLLELSPLPSVVPQQHTSLGLAPAPATERVDSGGTSGASHALTTAPYRVALDDITHLEAPDTGLLASAALQAGPPSEDTAPPRARRERPSPPSSPFDDESTVVNVGQKRPQERTVVMDVRTLAKVASGAAISAPSPSGSVDVTTTREYSAAELLGALEVEAEPQAEGESEQRPPGSLPRVLQPPNSAVSSAGTPATLGSPAAPLEPLRAVRVAVARGTGRELAVRLLDDGEAPPPGTQEAFLLALKP